MAKKKTKTKAAAPAKDVKAAEKAAKRAARMEALKNRPAEQRTNSKQIDVIDLGDGNLVKNYGYAIKQKSAHVGVVVTSVAMHNGEITGTSVSFIPGNLTVKSKKNHGTICAPKVKKAGEAEETEDDED